MTTTQGAPRVRNLVDVACERMNYKYPFMMVGQVFRGARLTREDIIAGLEGQGTEWFDAAAQKAQENLARSRLDGVGPPTFRELTDAQVLGLVHEKLKVLLTSYDGGNVVVIGKTGCGKSLASFALLRRVRFQRELDSIRRDPNWYGGEGGLSGFERERVYSGDGSEPLPYFKGWVRAHDLHSAAMRHPLGEGTPPVVAAAKTDPILVIDDLQTAQKDDTTVEVLWHRYDARLPTIVTCGLPKTKLLERFGDAFGRRLIESGGERGTFVDCFQGGK